MELASINTWDQLEDYLLERMDLATDEQSNSNKSFTKVQIWNDLIGQCMTYSGKDLSIKTKHILLKNVKKDFN